MTTYTTTDIYAARCADAPDPAAPVTVTRADVERARDAFAWDHGHYTRRYAPDDTIAGYGPPERRSVDTVRRLTAALGGYRVGDYVAVPTPVVPVAAFGPSVRPDYPARGYTRVRVADVTGDTLTVACDDPGAHHDRPHITARVPADAVFYVI